MEQLPVNPGIAWLIVSTVTGGGLWFVIKMVRQYQRDFTGEYAARNTALEAQIEALRQVNYALTHRAIECASELRVARSLLRQHNISWSFGGSEDRDDPDRTPSS